jgi:hypothetical protein
MTNWLLGLITAAALSSSFALLFAALQWPWLADVAATTAAVCGVTSFTVVALWTVRRARAFRPEDRR